ncbi:MAG: CHC2 zinc finger domain-containing protein [Peptococcaceae bacterium]|nr:CHC2 zinc finger domain-containing protein [Peptococcaceae bacterium]
MPKIVTSDYEFDLTAYLDAKNINYQWSGKNLMLCCPFHAEVHPSFGINAATGKYNCFSGSCKAHGHLEGFIQKLENLPSLDAAQAWLRGRCGTNPDEVGKAFDLVFGGISKDVAINFIPEEKLNQWDYRHPFLAVRGIPDLWQRRFRVGYDQGAAAITLPWFDRQGRCVGVKMRSVLDKHFWVYHLSEVGPNKITLFGINHVYRRREASVAIVESEIDAMYLWANGYPAIALGTAHITDKQLQELKNCPIESVTIATDNDAAGRKIATDLPVKLHWINDIRQVNWEPFRAKDVNELDGEQLRVLFGQAMHPVQTLFKSVGNFQ